MPPWRPNEFADKPERQQVFHELFRFADLPDRRFREVRAMYYGMIRQIDDYVGRVLDTLTARGLDENTIVMFTSDHGDYAGEDKQTFEAIFGPQFARAYAANAGEDYKGSPGDAGPKPRFTISASQMKR